jgi:hypothetical protein
VVMDLYEYTRLTIRCCRSDSAPTARALRMADGEMATVIRAMAFRDDGRSLAVLSNDQKVNVYEVPGGTLQAVIPLTSPGVDISFNASGTKPGIWTRQRSEIVYREEIMGTGDLTGSDTANFARSRHLVQRVRYQTRYLDATALRDRLQGRNNGYRGFDEGWV